MSIRPMDATADSMSGRLVIVPTPIGNLGDITLRSIEALRGADAIFSEDTRVTSKLLSALKIDAVRPERLDENVLDARKGEVVSRVAQGQTVAYCTDAGMPGVSDPGLRLVAALREEGLSMEVLPGASAAVTAYVASGTTCPRFYFGGFFPRKQAERERLLAELAPLDAALVFYEGPARVAAALDAIAKAFPTRKVAVCRELTKSHEEIVRGSAGDVSDLFRQRTMNEDVRGEIAIVIDPPSTEEAEEQKVEARAAAKALAAELAAQGRSQKSVASALAKECGISRNEAFDIALAAKKASS